MWIVRSRRLGEFWLTLRGFISLNNFCSLYSSLILFFCFPLFDGSLAIIRIERTLILEVTLPLTIIAGFTLNTITWIMPRLITCEAKLWLVLTRRLSLVDLHIDMFPELRARLKREINFGSPCCPILELCRLTKWTYITLEISDFLDSWVQNLFKLCFTDLCWFLGSIDPSLHPPIY